MVRVAYFSEASSIYDDFFLRKLSEKFDVSLLTFNKKFRKPSVDIETAILPEIIGQLPAHDSPRIYSTMLLKTIVLRTWLRRIAPDVLIGCSIDYGLVSALSRFRPFVSFVWGSEVVVLPRLLPFRAMMSYVLARADCVVLDSYAHFEACVKLGCDPGKIVRLPWIDSGELIRYSEAIERRRDEFRNSLGWSAGDVVIICTRSHAPIYDVECIVKSAPMVLKQCPDVRFLFVGNGPLTEKLKRLAVSLGITKNVHFTGYLDRRQLLECLINSDIYVSSSLSDGTSASLMEAMASKLPCVVSDIPGNREWISNNENGLLFATRDSHSLATHLVDLIRDDARRAELGALGYETTKMRANWESNSGQLVSAIQSLGSAA